MGRRKEADQPNKATIESRSERWKESLQASSILNRLKDHGDGKLQKPLEATQIKAYEVILDRIAPKLSAVEQTNVNEMDAKSPEEVLGLVRALITANPELLARLNLTSKPVLAPSAEAKEAA
jgi:hypothetical protein